VLAEASIGRLFLAGVAPGIVMGLSMMITVYYLGVTGKEPMPLRPRQNLCQVWVAFRRAFLTLLAPLILLGGIAFGIVTPTEAGVVAVLYAIVLGLCYREIIFRELPGILNDTALQTATVMFILAGASIFGWIMTIERVPTHATLFILGITENKMLILLLLNVMLLALGMFLNSSTILVLTIPIIKPLIVMLGIDPVHFGIVMTFNVMIGMLTPPLGICLYIAADIADAPFERVIRAVLPFYVPLFVTLLLITYFPGWVMFLPDLLLPNP
jgi:TRAP-type transport system large permease protein